MPVARGVTILKPMEFKTRVNYSTLWVSPPGDDNTQYQLFQSVNDKDNNAGKLLFENFSLINLG